MMPAYNFKKSFAAAVLDGTKRQTIRPPRKRRTVPGEALYLYTGMRTKQCAKLLETTVKRVYPIVIHEDKIEFPDFVALSPGSLDAFAEADGFSDFSQMAKFFKKEYTLPFYGEVIKW